MGAQLKVWATYTTVYGLVWLALAQLNAFASQLSLYVTAWWVFVFFPAQQHGWRVGLWVTLLAGVFFESQYPPLRGLLLPVMLVVFLGLSHWRTHFPELRSGALWLMASTAHWVLVAVPSVLLIKLGRIPDHEGFAERVLLEGVCGQLLLFVLLPLLSALWSRLEGHSAEL